MGLHILKTDDILELQDGFFKVKEVVDGERVSLIPCPMAEIPSEFFKRWSKKKRLGSSVPKAMAISDCFEGKVIRQGYEIDVISRDRFKRLKGIK